jgi:hypothetical protein
MDKSLEDAIKEAWSLIDFIRERLKDNTLTEKDRAHWAGLLNEALRTLEKLYEKVGFGSKDDLSTLLSKIPDEKESKKFIKVKKRLEKISLVVKK